MPLNADPGTNIETLLVRSRAIKIFPIAMAAFTTKKSITVALLYVPTDETQINHGRMHLIAAREDVPLAQQMRGGEINLVRGESTEHMEESCIPADSIYISALERLSYQNVGLVRNGEG